MRTHTDQDDMNHIEVCEIYTKPRFGQGQRSNNFSMNAPDEYGNKWDFTKASSRETVRTFIKENKPREPLIVFYRRK